MSKSAKDKFLFEFIELYKNLPCLWKVKSKEYTDRNKKASAYEVLVEKLREKDATANREAVVKKINNIRSSFRKELKKIKKSKVSGAGEYKVYVPSLAYFEALSFLSEQDAAYPSANSMDDTEDEIMSPGSNEIDSIHTEDSDITSKPTKKVRREKRSDQTDNLIALACAQFDTGREDQFDTAGKTFAAKLRSISKEQRIYAEKLINDVLFEAELSNLNRNYCLVDRTQNTQPGYFQSVQQHFQNFNESTSGSLASIKPEHTDTDNELIIPEDYE